MQLGTGPRGDPRGAFAVLADKGGDLRVSIERVSHDANAVAGEIRAVGLPGALGNQLLAGG